MVEHMRCVGLLCCALATVMSSASAMATERERSALPCSAFVGVAVVPMDYERMLRGQTVVVRGDRVALIGSRARVEVPPTCNVIDGRDRYLIPGLIDTHVHFFGYSRAGASDRHVELAIAHMLLANGITTAAVMEGTPSLLTLRREITRERLLAPSLYVAGALIQEPNSGELPGRRTFSTPADVRAEVAEEKIAGYDFIKVHGDLQPETYAALMTAARSANLPVIGHVRPNLPEFGRHAGRSLADRRCVAGLAATLTAGRRLGKTTVG